MTVTATRQQETLDDRYDAVCDAGNLTRRQLLIWAGNRLVPDAPLFTEGALLHLHGRIDAAAFARAYRATIAEADALRMVVDEVDGWPRQRLREVPATDVTLVEVASTSALRDLAAECFAATTAGDRPAVAAVLARLEPEHHVWLSVQHQLVSDSSSFWLLQRRVSARYERVVAGSDDAPPAPPQFREYLAYERRHRASAAGRASRAYWQRHAAAVTTARPALDARIGRDGTRVERAACRLDAATSVAIRQLALAEGPSLDVGVFCVFASVVLAHLRRLAATDELTLGVPFANRPTAAFKSTIGSFMNVCPVRVTAERDDTFRRLYRRARDEAWEAARHQGYATRLPRPAQPYDVLVNVHKAGVAVPDFAGVPSAVEWLAPTHRFGALAINVEDFSGTGMLGMAVDFNVAAFPPPARRQVLDELLGLLAACVADPDRRPADVAVAPPPRASHGADADADLEETLSPAEVERTVAAIWCELLTVARVEPADDFFALGGDSLLMHRMLARVRSALATELPLDLFLDDPTLRGLVTALADGAEPGASDD